MSSFVVKDVITFPEHLQTTSGVSIVLHGAFSNQDAISSDNLAYHVPQDNFSLVPNCLLGPPRCKTRQS